jgi:hypothetical protein
MVAGALSFGRCKDQKVPRWPSSCSGAFVPRPTSPCSSRRVSLVLVAAVPSLGLATIDVITIRSDSYSPSTPRQGQPPPNTASTIFPDSTLSYQSSPRARRRGSRWGSRHARFRFRASSVRRKGNRAFNMSPADRARACRDRAIIPRRRGTTSIGSIIHCASLASTSYVSGVLTRIERGVKMSRTCGEFAPACTAKDARAGVEAD